MSRGPAGDAALGGRPVSRLISDRRLLALAERAGAGERLGFDDGLLLYETADLTGVAAMAHLARTRLHGDRAYFVRSRRASYTNVCIADCRFCAFHEDPGAPGGYTLPPAEFADRLAEAESQPGGGAAELHMVGGLNPELKIEYFEGLLRAIKARLPAMHVKAFTMVEIDFYAKNSGVPVGEFLDRCIAAGLGSCPGGGAEIFDAEVRARICPGKGGAGAWLETAMACHERGLPTNCTMLYGHVEGPGHRVGHLLRLRGAQDRALARGLAGFSAYVPLAYQPGGNPLGLSLKIPRTTGARDLRELAVGRLLLDNVPHVKAHWHMVTPGLAQAGLSYGADDLDGTAAGEEIAHRAGAGTPPGLGADRLRRLISEAGFDAVERIPLHSGVPAGPGAGPKKH